MAMNSGPSHTCCSQLERLLVFESDSHCPPQQFYCYHQGTTFKSEHQGPLSTNVTLAFYAVYREPTPLDFKATESPVIHTKPEVEQDNKSHILCPQLVL